jgi:ribosomal protein S18 acetylase RimI-like enzyme
VRTTVRAAGTCDSEAIALLILESATHAFLSSFAPQGRTRFLVDHSPERIRSRIESTHFSYYVAEAEDKIVGVVGMRSQTHLFNLFVSVTAQHQGIGRLLWKHALDNRNAPVGPDVVTVNSSLNAVSFYQKLGFEIVGTVQEVDGLEFVPMHIVLVDRP